MKREGLLHRGSGMASGTGLRIGGQRGRQVCGVHSGSGEREKKGGHASA